MFPRNFSIDQVVDTPRNIVLDVLSLPRMVSCTLKKHRDCAYSLRYKINEPPCDSCLSYALAGVCKPGRQRLVSFVTVYTKAGHMRTAHTITHVPPVCMLAQCEWSKHEYGVATPATNVRPTFTRGVYVRR